MKLGVNSVLFGGFDMETAFKYTLACGYDGIELSAIEGMSEHLVIDRWREIAPKAKELSKQYNLPILAMEQPSQDAAKEMVALGKEKRIPYGINLNHRFTPAAVRAKEWVNAGRCGEVNMIEMFMWINNPNETSPHFHMRALHPHSIDVMRYFGGDVKKVHAFFKKGPGRKCWSNVHVNMMFESGVIGHLMGSYDGGGPGHHWGLEECQIIGYDGRIVITDACEILSYQPRKSIEAETYKYLGGMRSFGDTFQSRLTAWIDDIEKKTPADKVDAKAEDALKAQLIIEAAIESFEKETVVSL